MLDFRNIIMLVLVLIVGVVSAAQPDNLLQTQQIKLANGDWVVAAMFESVATQTGGFYFMAPDSGEKLFEVTFPLNLTNKRQLSVFTAIDSQQRGFVDAIYVGDRNGVLRKIVLVGKADVQQLNLSRVLAMPVAIEGKLIVGKAAAQGEKVYILLSESEQTPSSVLALHVPAHLSQAEIVFQKPLENRAEFSLHQGALQMAGEWFNAITGAPCPPPPQKKIHALYLLH